MESTPQQRFGYFAKTGQILSADNKPGNKPKPSSYRLVDVSCGQRTIFAETGSKHYALLKHLQKEHSIPGKNKLIIEPVFN